MKSLKNHHENDSKLRSKQKNDVSGQSTYPKNCRQFMKVTSMERCSASAISSQLLATAFHNQTSKDQVI